MRRSVDATLRRTSGSRISSGGSGRPSTNRVTRNPSGSRNATTSGAIPSFAATRVAACSAWRSIPSSGRVLASDPQDERVAVYLDLEVSVRDAAPERLEHELPARPNARGDLLRLHRAILDWRRWPFALSSSTSTGRSPRTSRSSSRSSRSSSARLGSRSPRPSTTTGWRVSRIPRSSRRGWDGQTRKSLPERFVATENAPPTATRSPRKRARRCAKRRSRSPLRSSRDPRGRRSSPWSKRPGLSPSIVAIVAAEDVERGKPDPGGYLRALELLGLEPDEAVAVEDSEVGVAAAKAAGAPLLCGFRHASARPAGPGGWNRRAPRSGLRAASAGVGFTRAEPRSSSRLWRTARSTR